MLEPDEKPGLALDVGAFGCKGNQEDPHLERRVLDRSRAVFDRDWCSPTSSESRDGTLASWRRTSTPTSSRRPRRERTTSTRSRASPSRCAAGTFEIHVRVAPRSGG